MNPGSARATFDRGYPGQRDSVTLPVGQQRVLDQIDRALQARDPRLAAIFAAFTRLTREDGAPHSERLAQERRPLRARLPGRRGWSQIAGAVPLALVAGLMTVIVLIGMATSSGPGCASASGHYPSDISRVAICRSADMTRR